MSGNSYPYNPALMFQDWIRESGNAQAQFVKSFADLMNIQSQKEFNPLKTLQEITDKAAATQAKLMAEAAAAQSKSLAGIFGLGHAAPSFLDWGAYKTAIGSNGRISIPEAEREALGLGEGDLVQVVIIPVAKRSKQKEVKE